MGALVHPIARLRERGPEPHVLRLLCEGPEPLHERNSGVQQRGGLARGECEVERGDPLQGREPEAAPRRGGHGRHAALLDEIGEEDAVPAQLAARALRRLGVEKTLGGLSRPIDSFEGVNRHGDLKSARRCLRPRSRGVPPRPR